ncbi:MAG: hypothetical protein JWR83_2865 [Aeromicrobium sp.]|nr:hypothetical protein [Aeromicrobium sp.]
MATPSDDSLDWLRAEPADDAYELRVGSYVQMRVEQPSFNMKLTLDGPPVCIDKSHNSEPRRVADCEHLDCVVDHVHER